MRVFSRANGVLNSKNASLCWCETQVIMFDDIIGQLLIPLCSIYQIGMFQFFIDILNHRKEGFICHIF